MTGDVLLASLSLFILVVGAGLAFTAETYPAQTSTLELVAGFLVVGGLSLIGIGLYWALNPLLIGWP